MTTATNKKKCACCGKYGKNLSVSRVLGYEDWNSGCYGLLYFHKSCGSARHPIAPDALAGVQYFSVASKPSF